MHNPTIVCFASLRLFLFFSRADKFTKSIDAPCSFYSLIRFSRFVFLVAVIEISSVYVFFFLISRSVCVCAPIFRFVAFFSYRLSGLLMSNRTMYQGKNHSTRRSLLLHIGHFIVYIFAFRFCHLMLSFLLFEFGYVYCLLFTVCVEDF